MSLVIALAAGLATGISLMIWALTERSKRHKAELCLVEKTSVADMWQTTAKRLEAELSELQTTLEKERKKTTEMRSTLERADRALANTADIKSLRTMITAQLATDLFDESNKSVDNAEPK